MLKLIKIRFTRILLRILMLKAGSPNKSDAEDCSSKKSDSGSLSVEVDKNKVHANSP